MEEDKNSNEHVLRRLNDLEKHLINLIHPLQNLHVLERTLNQISQAVATWERQIDNADKRFEKAKAESSNMIERLCAEMEKHNFSQTAGEIKYIGNRLLKIETALLEIQTEGLKKDVQISVLIDGKNDEKKKNEEISDPVLDDFLDFFKESPSVLKYIKACAWIRSSKPSLYIKELGISRERFYQVRHRAARMLRSEKLDKILKGLKDKKFALWLAGVAKSY